MPEGQEPNSDQSQVDNQDTRDTQTPGTPEQDGQEPTTQNNPQTFDAEYVQSLRNESAKHRTELRKAQADLKKYQDAELNESERLRKQSNEANTRLQQLEAELRQERGRNAVATAASKVGIPADLAHRLIDLEYDDEGQISTDLDRAVQQIASDYPGLVANVSSSGSPTNPQRQRQKSVDEQVDSLLSDQSRSFWHV